MGFEPHQQRSKLESVSKYVERIKSALEKVKSIVQKAHNDMARYYNQYCIHVLVFEPGDKIFLDFSDIYTIHSFTKLLHCQLRPYSRKTSKTHVILLEASPYSYT